MALADVGFASDERFLDHAEPGHPERPDRLRRLLSVLEDTDRRRALTPIDPEGVDDALLSRVHSPDQIALVDRISRDGGGRIDADTYVSACSAEVARLAAGAVVGCVDAVLSGRIRRGFAAVRPPGHHATGTRSMGFCLFNNVALGAHHARARGCERVAIVDWDVHHGNGTNDIFYEDPDVAFASTHEFPLYPGTGRAGDTGGGAGAGATLNVPLPSGTGDRGLTQVFDALVLPFVRRARPDLLLVSAGFDAHHRDPLASLTMSTGGFFRLTRLLVEIADDLCQGRIVVVLEGGYDLEAIAWSACATISALGDVDAPDDPLDPSAPAIEPDLTDLVRGLRTLHALD